MNTIDVNGKTKFQRILPEVTSKIERIISAETPITSSLQANIWRFRFLYEKMVNNSNPFKTKERIESAILFVILTDVAPEV
jgi:hypothetical protein